MRTTCSSAAGKLAVLRYDRAQVTHRPRRSSGTGDTLSAIIGVGRVEDHAAVQPDKVTSGGESPTTLR